MFFYNISIFSHGSIIVHSEILFWPTVFTDTVFTDNFDLSNGIQDIIILDSSLGKTSLLIDISEVYVIGRYLTLTSKKKIFSEI